MEVTESVIENGASASIMESLRAALTHKGIASYDSFSPEIMGMIAYHKRKIRQTTSNKEARA